MKRISLLAIWYNAFEAPLLKVHNHDRDFEWPQSHHQMVKIISGTASRQKPKLRIHCHEQESWFFLHLSAKPKPTQWKWNCPNLLLGEREQRSHSIRIIITFIVFSCPVDIILFFKNYTKVCNIKCTIYNKYSTKYCKSYI